MENTNSINVLEALVSNNRSELGKTFGVGMFVSETDTPEQVKAKCKSFVARFETYIANLNMTYAGSSASARDPCRRCGWLTPR